MQVLGLSKRQKGHRRDRKKHRGPTQTTVSSHSHSERQVGASATPATAVAGGLSDDQPSAAPRRAEQVVYSSAPKLNPEYTASPATVTSQPTSVESASKHTS